MYRTERQVMWSMRNTMRKGVNAPPHRAASQTMLWARTRSCSEARS